jgi:pimeloyl-ACP methyl ester carboxylesterase
MTTGDWVLLRGLTREARHWGDFEATMRAHGLVSAGQRVWFIDLPGNGGEHVQAAPLSVASMTAFVRARAAALGVRMPCRVIAMSLGAMAASAWAHDHPDEIARLVLINTSMRPYARLHERLRPSAWPMLIRIATAWPHAERCEQLIHTLTCNRTDTFDTDVAHWAALRRSHGAGAMNALRQLIAAARYRASSSAPRCPVLMLSSAKDALVDPVCTDRVMAQWHASHAVHAWAGHDLPHDDANWTCDAIVKWLAEPADAGLSAQSLID